jgi:5-methyltetrahydropteroyltriglutamate--homocysteine methyltransferase
MLTQNLGYPRIGGQRELKKVCENYWAGKTGHKNVLTVGKTSATKTGRYKKMPG